MKIFDNLFSPLPKTIYNSIEDGNINEIREYLTGAKELGSKIKLENMLYYAIDNCQNDYFNTIVFLINSGSNINSHQGKFLETPLHRLCARLKPRIDLITIILKKGAEANAINSSGKTPLFHCNFNYSVELLNLLVKYGADINIKDKYKNTILHDNYISCFDEHFEEFLKVLINLGFDLNSTNSTGLTPLSLCENKKVKEILIKYGGIK